MAERAVQPAEATGDLASPGSPLAIACSTEKYSVAIGQVRLLVKQIVALAKY